MEKFTIKTHYTKNRIITSITIIIFLLTIFGFSLHKGVLYFKLESNIQSIDNQYVDYVDTTPIDEDNSHGISYIIYKPADAKNCVTPRGVELKNGENVIAYKQRDDVNTLCNIEKRICENGKLSGTYKQKYCMQHISYEYVKQDVICYNCEPDNPFIQPNKHASNYLAEFNTEGKVEGPSAQLTKRDNSIHTEYIGNYSDVGQTDTTKKNCSAPWGEEVQHGFFTKAYKSHDGFINSPCIVELRYCTDGILNGTYQNASCTYHETTYESYTQNEISCKTGYHTENNNCTLDQKKGNCRGLPNNAIRNITPQITQTRNNGQRSPSLQGTHNLTPSNTECRFVCSQGYQRDGEACTLVQRQSACQGLPTNATRNTVNQITQTRNNGQRSPSNQGQYTTLPSNKECRFTCNSGFNRNGSTCSVHIKPQFNITYVEQLTEGGEGIDNPQCGTHNSCNQSQTWAYTGRTLYQQYDKPGTADSCRYWRWENIHVFKKRRQRKITECMKTFTVQEGDLCGSACVLEKDPNCSINATMIIDKNGNCVNIPFSSSDTQKNKDNS